MVKNKLKKCVFSIYFGYFDNFLMRNIFNIQIKKFCNKLIKKLKQNRFR